MLGDVLGEEVLVASNVALAGSCVLELVVLCLEQALGFFSPDIQLDPLLVDGVANALCGDTGVLEPRVDGIYSVLWWSENVDDLFWRIPLPKA